MNSAQPRRLKVTLCGIRRRVAGLASPPASVGIFRGCCSAAEDAGVTLAGGVANAGKGWNWRPWSNDTYAALQLHSQGLVAQTKAFLCPLLFQQTTYWTKSHVSYFFPNLFFPLLLFILKVWYLELRYCHLKVASADNSFFEPVGISADSPLIDLHLIFEKSSLKNQVNWTWFFVYFKLEFFRLHRQ